MSIQLTDATPVDRAAEILTSEALAFVQRLQERFGARRDQILEAREERRVAAAAIGRLDFLVDTRHVREPTGRWPTRRQPSGTAGSR